MREFSECCVEDYVTALSCGIAMVISWESYLHWEDTTFTEGILSAVENEIRERTWYRKWVESSQVELYHTVEIHIILAKCCSSSYWSNCYLQGQLWTCPLKDLEAEGEFLLKTQSFFIHSLNNERIIIAQSKLKTLFNDFWPQNRIRISNSCELKLKILSLIFL